jgi:hypothetical protein
MSIDFQELKKSVLTEHNRLRQDPKSYIPILESKLKKFDEKVLVRPGDSSIITKEGPQAYHEAIAFLSSQKPLEALTFDERLGDSCLDHVNDIGPKGLVSHESTTGKSLSDRIEVYSEWDTSCAENVELGGKTGEDVIVSLLVDDGIPSRGHRLNLFNQEFKYLGVACGNHRVYGAITVLNYAGGLRDKDTPFFDYSDFKYEYPADVDSSIRSSNVESSAKKLAKKTFFQLQDDDAPEGTTSVKILKNLKLFDGKKVTITKKFYTLENGHNHVVEVEEF